MSCWSTCPGRPSTSRPSRWGSSNAAWTSAVPGAEAEVLHANLEFTDWITARTPFTGDDYEYYALSSYFMGCGGSCSPPPCTTIRTGARRSSPR